MAQLNLFVECSAFILMLGLSVLIGLYYGCVERKQSTIDDYLLGGKRMSVFPITMSLIASCVSGVTLLGVPSEIYSFGTQYSVVCLADVFIISIIIYIYLPVFYDLQLKSAYEYLELRFDSNIRLLSSLIFVINIIIYIPMVIYVPALAVNQVTGVSIHLITPVMCVVCIFYTTIGGLKAVVWTDAIQSVFTMISLTIVIILGLKEVGGFGEMIKANQQGNRLDFIKMDPNPFLRHTFWTLGVGTTVCWTYQLGLNPGSIQRFVSLPTYNKARKSLIYFILGIAIIKVFSIVTGMLIYTEYKDCDPISAGHIKNDKSLLPFYVMEVAAKLPGLTGLFVSGIASASLSTLSAQLNTVSGTIYEDFVVKIARRKFSESTASIIMKCIVVIAGVICVSLVFIVDKLGAVLQMAISLIGMTTGAMLSVFTLGVCFPCANSRGAMWGTLASLIVMVWIAVGAQIAIYKNELMFVKKEFSIAGCPANTTIVNSANFTGLHRLNEDVYASADLWKIYTVSYQHYPTVGFLVGIVVGVAVSLLFPMYQNVDPKLLTPCVRKFVNPKCTEKKKLDDNKTEEYTLAVFKIPKNDDRRDLIK